MSAHSSTLVITPGDPAGIGPDIAVSLQTSEVNARIVLVGDREMLAERAQLLGEDFSCANYAKHRRNESKLEIHHIECSDEVVPGKPNPNNAQYTLNTLEYAIEGCLRGEFEALVTGPLNKQTVREAGIDFYGHTEFLAAKTGSKCPVMLLADDQFRVSLVTTHLPLLSVPAAVTKARIMAVARVLNEDLKQRFQIQKPRIAACGLNPHAGEGGTMGREDIDEIVPAIEALQLEGIGISGPYPADTVFAPKHVKYFDVVLAMYHDQGLPVVKHRAFGSVVNVTLGLPIIRTSVDHGTAYDIAGSGMADSQSMLSAISMAKKLCRNSFQYEQ